MGKRPSLHQPAPSEGAASGELSERSTGTLVCAISSLMSEVSVPEALTTPPPPSLPSAPPSPPKPRCLVEGAEPGPSAFSMILCSRHPLTFTSPGFHFPNKVASMSSSPRDLYGGGYQENHLDQSDSGSGKVL
uniref:Uncharacterized protein n=1 Tax=Rangifer tarandus platyrhynchus TaxID=3082113 RepID=A0ACB0FIM1_RANTA|nr:unnamed protein product [Rangifer tarandus platyrhynchus]